MGFFVISWNLTFLGLVYLFMQIWWSFTKRVILEEALSDDKRPPNNFWGCEDDDEHGGPCGACGDNFGTDEFWICCDECEKWFHGRCVKITPAKAEHIKHYKCPSCTNKRARPWCHINKKKTDNWVLEDDKNIRFFFKLFSFHYGLRICTIGNAFLFFLDFCCC